MKIIEINGILYNLSQFVALEERSRPSTDGETCNGKPTERELVITFSGGIKVFAPLTERERIRGVIIAESKRVTAQDLELTVVPMTLREARELAEREIVTQALKRHSGRITSAAADLGISRPTLYELIEKLGLSKVGWAEPESEETQQRAGNL